MKICVIGTGYVGLVTGVGLADMGNNVTCVDNNPEKLAVLKAGKAPFYEPGLSEKMQRGIQSNRLLFTDDLQIAVKNSQVVFIAVGTPALKSGEADLSAVFAVAKSIFEACKGSSDRKVIVTKSTVPVGTGSKLTDLKLEMGLSDDLVSMVSNPEFLREGTAIHDFFHPDRIVIGGQQEWALDIIADLYEPLYRVSTPIVRTNLSSSELSKYASNAFLATKISFINEVANLCEKVGADVTHVSKIMGMDGRIGKYFLHPGPGYGGSCFPKDVQALSHIAKIVGYDFKLADTVDKVNDLQKIRILEYIDSYFGENLEGKTFAILGISFKPNTDDIRESSSVVIIQELQKRGATIQAFDPEVKQTDLDKECDNVTILESSYDAAENADAVLLLTEWNMFRDLNLERLKSLMKTPVFFDCRNVYSPQKLKQVGFTCYVIGREPISK